MVLEGVPDVVGRLATDALEVPTIGIGAGPWCDGQVLVYHDLLGLEDRVVPTFVRRYADLKRQGVEALSAFAADVRACRFRRPGELPPEARGSGARLDPASGDPAVPEVVSGLYA